MRSTDPAQELGSLISTLLITPAQSAVDAGSSGEVNLVSSGEVIAAPSSHLSHSRLLLTDALVRVWHATTIRSLISRFLESASLEQHCLQT